MRAGSTRFSEAQRLRYRSRDGEKVLFRDLVAHHYLPTIKDAAPNARKKTALHLGNGIGAAVRKGHDAQRAARSGAGCSGAGCCSPFGESRRAPERDLILPDE